MAGLRAPSDLIASRSRSGRITYTHADLPGGERLVVQSSNARYRGGRGLPRVNYSAGYQPSGSLSGDVTLSAYKRVETCGRDVS